MLPHTNYTYLNTNELQWFALSGDFYSQLSMSVLDPYIPTHTHTHTHTSFIPRCYFLFAEKLINIRTAASVWFCWC